MSIPLYVIPLLPLAGFLVCGLSGKRFGKGFVTACGYVRPDGIETMEPKSVRKKLKQPSFAAGVNRDEVAQGAELLGLELDQHIANVIQALRPIAGRLGMMQVVQGQTLAVGSAVADVVDLETIDVLCFVPAGPPDWSFIMRYMVSASGASSSDWRNSVL